MLVHAVRLLLEAHPELVAIKLDATSAFNSVNRQPMMNELKTHFPGLAPFFERMYLAFPAGDKGPRILFGCKDGKIRVIWSREGTTQGDPGGPLLFALAIQPALEEIQAKLGSEGHVLAYLDDVFLLVPAPQAAHSLRVAEEALGQRCGLRLKLSKCKIFDPAGGRVRGPDFEKGGRFFDVPQSTRGLLVVGGPVGSSGHQAQT